MKLKSLLLGSAAALVAFSGARAADAVIAEPEPVEYVRVCDAFGNGYFFIPGTETCLKIGGFVRYEIDIDSDADGWSKTTTASVAVTAKSDTEMGPLESFIDMRAKSGGSFLMDSAYLSLGGLKMGWFANAFDGGIVGEADSLGGSTGNTMSYTFAANGFDATIGLDHDNSTNYVPDVSGNIGFSAGAVAVRVFGAYDESVSEGVAKLRIGADVTEGGRFEVAALYASGITYVWNDSEWSVAAGYSQKVSDTVTVVLNAQYFGDTFAGSINGANTVVGGSAYALGAQVDWKPVTNFLVRGQVRYTEADFDDELTAKIRFQRSF